MPAPPQESYHQFIRSWLGKNAQEPDVIAQIEKYGEALLALWELDLEPAREILGEGYAPSPRGGRPWDPVTLLRALLLMLLVQQPSINRWVGDLKGSRVLRLLAGIDPDSGGCPGVGTFYDALHRLHDGPIRGTCEHQARPSEMERRRARSAQPRRRNRRQKARDGKPEAWTRKRRRGTGKRKSKQRSSPASRSGPVSASGVSASESASARVVAELAAVRQSASPNDLLDRLGRLLLDLAVRRSAEKGLLGKLDAIVIGGDGSPLRTGAARFGKKTCEHSRYESCECPRIWTDPDARVGYDPHRERYFFGHHFYEMSVSSQKHDLPVALRLDPGNESDFVASLRTFEHLQKTWKKAALPWKVDAVTLDAGHDGEAVYRYFLSHGVRPVIPLKSDAPGSHPSRPEVSLSKRGIPQCQAGLEMSSWGSSGPSRKVFLCPVKAGACPRCPLAPDSDPTWTCSPKKYGPTVSLSVTDNPRLCPPIPRNSKSFRTLYALRSGCERSNAAKKLRFRLEDARHRRASFWLIRLGLIAILQHVRAWLSGLDPGELVDDLLGRAQQTAAA